MHLGRMKRTFEKSYQTIEQSRSVSATEFSEALQGVVEPGPERYISLGCSAETRTA